MPNSGRGLPRLPYRIDEWDKDFSEYLRSLDKKKPLIYCGDLNVAHKEIGQLLLIERFLLPLFLGLLFSF